MTTIAHNQIDSSSLLDPETMRRKTTALDILDRVENVLDGLSDFAPRQQDDTSSSSSYPNLLEPSPINTRNMRVVEEVKLGDINLCPNQASWADLFLGCYNSQETTSCIPSPGLPCSTMYTYNQGILPLVRSINIMNNNNNYYNINDRCPLTFPSDLRENANTTFGHTVKIPLTTPSHIPSTISVVTALSSKPSSSLSSSLSMSSSLSSSDHDNNDEGDNDCSWPSSYSDRWVERFNDLKRFVRKHGHCHVPIRFEENPALSKWAKRQRYQWKLKKAGKHSTLTDHRERLLEDMGFLWNVRFSVWDQRFRELVAFRNIHGHTNVPLKCKRFPRLGTWIKCQRRQYRLLDLGRKSNITPGRITQLNDLGFTWKGREGTSTLDDGDSCCADDDGAEEASLSVCDEVADTTVWYYHDV